MTVSFRRRPARGGPGVPYLLLAPAAALFALILGYPLVKLLILSFQDFGLRALFTGTAEWVGLANYRDLASSEFFPALLRTVLFCGALVAGTLGIGLGVALLMGRLGKRMRGAVTFVLITAWAVPNVAATLIWQWLFQPLYGVVNWALGAGQHDWLATPLSAFGIVWLLVVWQSVPFVALTLYAGLSQIPRAYYEAAAIDGAGPLASFRAITLPFLRPILLLVTILSVIWDFNVFNQLWILTRGGPQGGTTTLSVLSFTEAFSSNAYGRGAAIAVVSVVLLMGLTAYYVRRLVRAGEEL
ncbi:sugar ABC transporter permease [Actinocorallia sp. A-T 12471]|uniref:carbohydrate ABC transporter permease n=1 Tax=Actinocorallia sp. A-T 12471 TaxID=3089813 RepID=UPI0029CE4EBD|nr:sugar ABC transporter permease [Actinocorallia sp. A-T 12471]MDX6739519.1 sugar ABC transporter permease [Actinocorallia sp. A-T 12471]